MNKTEQGVLQQSKLIRLLVHMLLLFVLCSTQVSATEAPVTEVTAHKESARKHHVFIVYSPDSTLHSDIARKLSENSELKRSDRIVTRVTTKQEIEDIDADNDVIISIGRAAIEDTNKDHPKVKKLFIVTDPNKYRLKAAKENATLYMTQSYCRQIKLIKLLDPHWKTISILSSQKKPIDNVPIRQCASRYNIRIYSVKTASGENQTNKIKEALSHSDVLLALPDSSIYNSRTVKNILLTSYRHRKPVIAFSKNFVNAGALAAIHSDTQQIAQSAGKIIEKYFDAGGQFERPVNYPDTFDININRQVFRALDIPVPDMERLKQSLLTLTQDDNGASL